MNPARAIREWRGRAWNCCEVSEFSLSRSLPLDWRARSSLPDLVPAVASPDAVHIALASVHGIDFLVTWNFKHIANPRIRERMRTTINEAGYRMPVMCSPEELLNDDEGV